MKAYYKTVLKGETAGRNSNLWHQEPTDIHHYKLVKFTDICCTEMQEALDEKVIGFGDFKDGTYVFGKDINIAKCYPFPEGASWSFSPIKFCPFCGAIVETEETDKVSLKMIERTEKVKRVDYEEVPTSP